MRERSDQENPDIWISCFGWDIFFVLFLMDFFKFVFLRYLGVAGGSSNRYDCKYGVIKGLHKLAV